MPQRELKFYETPTTKEIELVLGSRPLETSSKREFAGGENKYNDNTQKMGRIFCFTKSPMPQRENYQSLILSFMSVC